MTDAGQAGYHGVLTCFSMELLLDPKAHSLSLERGEDGEDVRRKTANFSMKSTVGATDDWTKVAASVIGLLYLITFYPYNGRSLVYSDCILDCAERI